VPFFLVKKKVSRQDLPGQKSFGTKPEGPGIFSGRNFCSHFLLEPKKICGIMFRPGPGKLDRPFQEIGKPGCPVGNLIPGGAFFYDWRQWAGSLWAKKSFGREKSRPEKKTEGDPITPTLCNPVPKAGQKRKNNTMLFLFPVIITADYPPNRFDSFKTSCFTEIASTFAGIVFWVTDYHRAGGCFLTRLQRFF
jgi:hypothetical protein